MKNYGLDQDKLQSFKALKPIIDGILTSGCEFNWYFTQSNIRPHESFIVRFVDPKDNRMIVIQTESILTPRLRITKSGYNRVTGISDQPDQHWLDVPVRSGVLKKAHDYIDAYLYEVAHA